jgi:plasmid stabilization system protein ParE
MALNIRWTPKATTWLDMQLTYWEENDLPNAAVNFSKDLDKKLNRLSDYPEIGRATSTFKKIRYINIDKRYNLFYRVNIDNIILLSFFDTRQDPDKKPY